MDTVGFILANDSAQESGETLKQKKTRMEGLARKTKERRRSNRALLL
jgi:hypothetical protein